MGQTKLKLALGFGSQEVVGDLRGSSCKPGTDEAACPGQEGIGGQGEEQAGPGYKREQGARLGCWWWCFCLTFSGSRAAHRWGQVERRAGVRRGEGEYQRRMGCGESCAPGKEGHRLWLSVFKTGQEGTVGTVGEQAPGHLHPGPAGGRPWASATDWTLAEPAGAALGLCSLAEQCDTEGTGLLGAGRGRWGGIGII